MRTKHFFKFSMLLLQRRTWFITLVHAVIVLGSLFFAWLLRFDFSLPHRRMLAAAVLILPIVRVVVFRAFNLLHGWWQYTGVSDAWDITKATVSGTVVFWLMMRFVPAPAGFPRSVFILEMVLTAVL